MSTTTVPTTTLEGPVTTLQGDEPVESDHIDALFNGEIAGLRIAGAFDPIACAQVVENVRRLGLQEYPAMANPLATLWPNHWSCRYDDGEWDAYFASLDDKSTEKAAVFAPLGGDPSALVNARLEPALGRPITRLTCPRTGRTFHNVIVRAGTAELHFDDGRYDLTAELRELVMRQLAFNIYLSNPGGGGELEVFKRLGGMPGISKPDAAANGSTVVGNYGFDDAIVAGVPSAAIPCEAGDLVLIRNQFLHRVRPVTIPELALHRIGISAHIVELSDGTYHTFN